MLSKISLVFFLVALSRASSPSKRRQPPYSFMIFHDNAKHARSVEAPELPVESLQVLPTPVPTAATPEAYVEPVAVPYEVQEPAVAVRYAAEPVAPQYQVGQYRKKYRHHVDEYDYAPPKYEYSYGVEDHVTGDIHSHRESRDGDVTQGEYSLHDADGTIKTVKYTVNGKSGFKAIVERTDQQQYQ